MTGSRISQIRDLVDNDFMLTYGDAVSDINLDNLKKFHNKHQKILTVTGVRPPEDLESFSQTRIGICIQ